MKQKSKMNDKPQAEINMLLYAVAPQPKLSTDAIALDGAVVSRGNGIGATPKPITPFDLQKHPLPNIGMKIKNISDPNLSSKNVPKLYLQEKTIQGRIFI